MSSRVTAVRSSQPRIGVGTADNMIELLLRAPRTAKKRRQWGGKIGSALFKSIGKTLPKAAFRSGKVVVKRGVQRGKVALKRKAKEGLQRGKVALKRKAKEGLQRGLQSGLSAIGDALNERIEDLFSE